ncbi:MAG: hypothetical protein AAFW74_05555 [Pseudomonadota bacterium]
MTNITSRRRDDTYGDFRFTRKLEKIDTMSRQTEISETPENRSVSRPTLILAIVLTIAWFAMLAIAIGTSEDVKAASAYGIDNFQAETLVASR